MIFSILGKRLIVFLSALTLKGHGFNRAEEAPVTDAALAAEGMHVVAKRFSQGLKPNIFFASLTARLKSCPFKAQRFHDRKFISASFVAASVYFVLTALVALPGYKGKDQGEGAPPANPTVIPVADMNLITLDPNDVGKFSLSTGSQIESASELSATGSVFPDISREVPVISLANGRVVDIKARLDDNVKKGQLLLKVQSPDITSAFDTYLKTANDEHAANMAYTRAQNLFEHGAISQAMLEAAEDTEKDAKADLSAAEEQLKTLGVDKNHPSSIVNVYAPISGVIVAQNVAAAGAAGVSLSGSATAFTIADLSTVWIVCDVFENDIPRLQLGQEAKIKLNAWPDRQLTGHISDIGPILDPTIRTARTRNS